MKTIVLASVIAVLATGSAFAATNHAHHLRHERRLSDPNAFMARDPYGVYIGGREIGRDPDPNVREQLYDDYYELQGN